jgi:hypothetical protein
MSEISGHRRASKWTFGALLIAPLAAFVVLTALRPPSLANGTALETSASAAYPDMPIPGHTGGFGEVTCTACHFDNDVDDPAGALSIAGFPPQPEPDSSYVITVTVTHDAIEAAGFQFAVRDADGSQAGNLSASDDRVVIAELDGIQYVQHSLRGLELIDGVGTWTFEWTAPPSIGSPLLVHAVGNAANGDRSEFGDFIYTAQVETGTRR